MIGAVALAKAEGFGSESPPMFTGTPARFWHPSPAPTESAAVPGLGLSLCKDAITTR